MKLFTKQYNVDSVNKFAAFKVLHAMFTYATSVIGTGGCDKLGKKSEVHSLESQHGHKRLLLITFLTLPITISLDPSRL